MAQLDVTKFLPQVIILYTSLTILYIFINNIILPNILSGIKLYNKLKSNFLSNKFIKYYFTAYIILNKFIRLITNSISYKFIYPKVKRVLTNFLKLFV